MSRHPAGEKHAIRTAADLLRSLRLAAFLLVLLAIAGCAGRLAPTAGPTEPSATATATNLPTAAPTTMAVTPTVKPTATFVPLPTPSATPEISLSEMVVPRISVEIAKQMVDDGEAVLVDVRSVATFARAHIAGAISLPAEEIPDRYQELPTDQLIVFY